MKMRQVMLIGLAAMSLAWGQEALAAVPNAAKPNILFIVADDKVTFLIDSGGESEVSGVFFDPLEGESVIENKTRLDDRDKAIQYSGPWHTWEGNGGYLNTEMFTSTPDAEASLTFTGTRLRWFGFKRWDLGIAEVYLDGQLKATVDCYGVSLQRLILFQSETLPTGPHTIKIRVKGEKNTAATGAQVIIDAFESFNSVPVPFITVDSASLSNTPK